jgi:hypothetical protein
MGRDEVGTRHGYSRGKQKQVLDRAEMGQRFEKDRVGPPHEIGRRALGGRLVSLVSLLSLM